MSKDKPKVPPTKVAPPTTIKCTKTQRELFVNNRNQLNEDAQTVLAVLNKNSSEILGKMVDNFYEELGIDIVIENWEFDANAVLFRKTAKPVKPEKK